MKKIESLAQQIMEGNQVIEVFDPYGRLILETICIPPAKWRCLYALIEIHFLAILSHSTLGCGGILNLIEKGLTSIITNALIGRETARFLLNLACAAGTCNILEQIRNDYTIVKKTDKSVIIKKY